MMYRLGCYRPDGTLECLQRVNSKNEAKLAYNRIKKTYHCTVWVQKIEFIDPKEEFKNVGNR